MLKVQTGGRVNDARIAKLIVAFKALSDAYGLTTMGSYKGEGEDNRQKNWKEAKTLINELYNTELLEDE